MEWQSKYQANLDYSRKIVAFHLFNGELEASHGIVKHLSTLIVSAIRARKITDALTLVCTQVMVMLF